MESLNSCDQMHVLNVRFMGNSVVHAVHLGDLPWSAVIEEWDFNVSPRCCYVSVVVRGATSMPTPQSVRFFEVPMGSDGAVFLMAPFAHLGVVELVWNVVPCCSQRHLFLECRYVLV